MASISNVLGSSSTGLTTIEITPSLLSKYALLALYETVSVPFQFASGVYVKILPSKVTEPFSGCVFPRLMVKSKS